jgi:hypothetical protein
MINPAGKTKTLEYNSQIIIQKFCEFKKNAVVIYYRVLIVLIRKIRT